MYFCKENKKLYCQFNIANIYDLLFQGQQEIHLMGKMLCS